MTHMMTKGCRLKTILCVNKNMLLKQIVHLNKLKPLLCFDMTKAEIYKCPNTFFNKRLFLISSQSDEQQHHVKEAIQRLMDSSVIGFDTETAVFFDKTVNNVPISLVQLATEDTVILWRLRKNGKYLRSVFPSSLKSILKNNKIRKVGTGNTGDLNDLYTQYNIQLSNVVDNQVLAKEIGLVKVGLVSLTAQLFGWIVSKNQRLSNWEASVLNHSQMVYAATDAWASLLVYKRLARILAVLTERLPKALPSYFENMLAKESQIDTKLFRTFNSQLTDGNLHHQTMESLLQHKYARLLKRKSQKVNISIDDIDVDFLKDYFKQMENKDTIHDHYPNNETSKQSERALLPHCCSEVIPSQIPFLYQSVLE